MNRARRLSRECAAVITLVFAGLLLMASAPAPSQPASTGEGLFLTHCARCHGEDGGRRKWGAADLRASVLPDALILRQIIRGKGVMPAFGSTLSPAEREAVMCYVKSLRQDLAGTERNGHGR